MQGPDRSDRSWHRPRPTFLRAPINSALGFKTRVYKKVGYGAAFILAQNLFFRTGLSQQ